MGREERALKHDYHFTNSKDICLLPPNEVNRFLSLWTEAHESHQLLLKADYSYTLPIPRVDYCGNKWADADAQVNLSGVPSEYINIIPKASIIIGHCGIGSQNGPLHGDVHLTTTDEQYLENPYFKTFLEALNIKPLRKIDPNKDGTMTLIPRLIMQPPPTVFMTDYSGKNLASALGISDLELIFNPEKAKAMWSALQTLLNLNQAESGYTESRLKTYTEKLLRATDMGLYSIRCNPDRIREILSRATGSNEKPLPSIAENLGKFPPFVVFLITGITEAVYSTDTNITFFEFNERLKRLSPSSTIAPIPPEARSLSDLGMFLPGYIVYIDETPVQIIFSSSSGVCSRHRSST